MKGSAKPIGDFGPLFKQTELAAYLEGGPPAVLLQDASADSFKAIHGTSPGETIFRSGGTGFDATAVSTIDLGALPKDVAFMVFTLGNLGGSKVGRCVVGCSNQADVQVNERSVSRRHAVIERIADEYYVEDNQSTHHTLINNQILLPGRRHRLSPGERVTLGTVDLTFLDPVGFFHFVRTFLA